MFYHIKLEHEILLHPKYFGPNLIETSIPPNIKFEGADTNVENNEDEEETQIVQLEDRIRLRIMGLRVDASDIFAVGTLMDDYLGPCV
ncbi:DNA-directed RNA polymerase II subunit RPB7 [Sparganum proliferum]